MKINEFKSVTKNILVTKGFDVLGRDFIFKGSDADILINIQELDKSVQYCINVGFHLNALDSFVSKKVELSHMYFRLERLFPHLREIILDGCNMKNFGQFKTVLSEECVPKLIELANSIDLIKLWFVEGGFDNGMIRKEVPDLFV